MPKHQWPLDGNHCGVFCRIIESDAFWRQTSLKPADDTLPIAGIHDKDESLGSVLLIGKTGYQSIIKYDRGSIQLDVIFFTSYASNQCVTGSTHRQVNNLPSQHRIQPFGCLIPFYSNSSHMRHIKNPHPFAGAKMLGNN